MTGWRTCTWPTGRGRRRTSTSSPDAAWWARATPVARSHGGPGASRDWQTFEVTVDGPKCNVKLNGEEPDFHWPEHKVVVEID